MAIIDIIRFIAVTEVMVDTAVAAVITVRVVRAVAVVTHGRHGFAIAIAMVVVMVLLSYILSVV